MPFDSSANRMHSIRTVGIVTLPHGLDRSIDLAKLLARVRLSPLCSVSGLSCYSHVRFIPSKLPTEHNPHCTQRNAHDSHRILHAKTRRPAPCFPAPVSPDHSFAERTTRSGDPADATLPAIFAFSILPPWLKLPTSTFKVLCNDQNSTTLSLRKSMANGSNFVAKG